jgi:hypothetical protein
MMIFRKEYTGVDITGELRCVFVLQKRSKTAWRAMPEPHGYTIKN